MKRPILVVILLTILPLTIAAKPKLIKVYPFHGTIVAFGQTGGGAAILVGSVIVPGNVPTCRVNAGTVIYTFAGCNGKALTLGQKINFRLNDKGNRAWIQTGNKEKKVSIEGIESNPTK